MIDVNSLLPSDFVNGFPHMSIFNKWEIEQVVYDCICILSNTGNIWRKVDESEYRDSRNYNDRYSSLFLSDWEASWFKDAVDWSVSPRKALLFCPTWLFENFWDTEFVEFANNIRGNKTNIKI